MTREIPLTQGFATIVDDEDYAWVMQWRWRFKRRNASGSGYAVRNTSSRGRRRTIYLHRALAGEPPCKVDHRSRDTLDNRKANLREATPSQNMANCAISARNTSGFKGVSRNGKRWFAELMRDRVTVFRQSFDTAEDAARAYDAAARIHFGEFAVLNFPDGARTAAETSADLNDDTSRRP